MIGDSNFLVLFSFFVFMTMFFLLILIHPVCMLVACIRSHRHTEKEKRIYFVAMLLTWGLGNLVYAIAASRSRALRLFTWMSLGLFFMSAIHLYAFYQNLPEQEQIRWSQEYKAALEAGQARGNPAIDL